MLAVPLENKLSLAYPRGRRNNLLVTNMQIVAAAYRPCAMPQPLGSSGGHMGTGNMLVRATVTLFWVEAEEVWVVATAPVRARTTTKVRTAIFINLTPFRYIELSNI